MLKIHFLNVGHGDCTLVEFPSGRTTLIDINNSKVIDEKTEAELASASDTYWYVNTKLDTFFKGIKFVLYRA